MLLILVIHRPVLTWKSGWRSMNLENCAFMASTRLDSMSWQCRGVRYSSTSTAVACSMARRLRTPGGISRSATSSTCAPMQATLGDPTYMTQSSSI